MTGTMIAEKQQETLKYPRSIFFIISNEFCERFSFYGMRTVLTLYLRNQLKFNDNMATVIYHVFTMFVYFFPIFGAIIADALLGKFRTIFYLSIIYALGQLLLALSAAPPVGIPPVEFSLLGLGLIALGTGGIKPCVAAFGGDQFVLPQQERYLSTFFSLFYFSINSGSLISSFLTPVLRSNVSCFGDNYCYSLAFFVPAVLMTASIIIFICGKPLYKILKPSGNVVLDVTKCVSHAIYNKATTKGKKREHWLDHADDVYDQSLINDIKAALQVMVLFIPIPVFWALFDQQGSRWTIQATRMDGEIGSFIVQPDQMQVFNPLLVLIFIPLFEVAIYPLMEKIGLRTPLKKLTIGGLLAALSFVISAVVELNLEPTYPVLPSQNAAQLRVFNTLNCPVNVSLSDDLSFVVDNMGMYEKKYIPVNYAQTLNYTVDFSKCYNMNTEVVKGSISINDAQANSWVIKPEDLSFTYNDTIDKSKTGDPLIRGLIYVDPGETSASLELRNKDGELVLKWDIENKEFNVTELEEVKPGTYDIYLKNEKVKSGVKLQLGGVYTVVGSAINGIRRVNVITVTEPNSVHILWLIPQYVIITMGEVMFSVTGLEFAFTQAPITMKSLLQATWLLTVAFGNLIVVIVAEVSIFDRQFHEFLLFAGLMFVDIIIFAIMAKFYKYVEVPDEGSVTEEINMELKDK